MLLWRRKQTRFETRVDPGDAIPRIALNPIVDAVEIEWVPTRR